MEGSTYSIQCSYIPGINSTSGCSYVLRSLEENVTNLTGTLPRTNAEQVQISELYSILSVFDVREDSVNSSDARLIITVSLNSAKKCPIAGMYNNYTNHHLLALGIVLKIPGRQHSRETAPPLGNSYILGKQLYPEGIGTLLGNCYISGEQPLLGSCSLLYWVG